MERNYFVKCNHLWSLNSIWRLWCVYKLLQEDAQIIKTFKHNLGQIWFFFKSCCSEYTCATCWLWEKSKGIWYSPFCPHFLWSESYVDVKGVFPGGMFDPQLKKMETTDVKQSFTPLAKRWTVYVPAAWIFHKTQDHFLGLAHFATTNYKTKPRQKWCHFLKIMASSQTISCLIMALSQTISCL